MQTTPQRTAASATMNDQTARIVFAVVVVAVTWIGEEFAGGGRPSFWYGRFVMGVPLVYPAIVGLLLLAAPFLLNAPRMSITARLKATGLWPWVVGVWVTLGFGVARALLAGVVELFADWRNLVVMAAIVIMLTPWLASRPWRQEVPIDLAIGFGATGTVVLVQWLAGGGAEVFDQRVTIFSWPHLFALTLSAIVATSVWLTGMRGLSTARAMAIRYSAVVTSVVVLLSFRRSFWLSLGVGVAGVLLMAGRRGQLNARRLTAIAALVAFSMTTLFVAMGQEAVIERFASFLPRSDGAYAATNEDHVNDLVEAINAIGGAPLLGLGVGQFYDTPLLEDWKETSFEVHNAALHVWLKFGVLGVFVFAGFHVRWIVASLQMQFSSPETAASFVGVSMYLVSQFANTIAQTWVYGRVQMTVHMAILFAVLLACAPDVRSQVSERRAVGVRA